jgi:hypothetical protein
VDRDDIINMAQTAGWEMPSTFNENDGFCSRLERFAALVAAHEREACAKVCDVLAVHPEYASDITKVAAQAIRARGNK